MIDKNLVELGFQDFYQELWRRRSVADILGTRPDALLYEVYRAAASRFYALGIEEGARRAEEKHDRVRRAVEEDPRLPPRRPQEAVESFVTSRNPEGTASALHIPIVIEGVLSPDLDRSRPVGEYTGGPDD